MSPVSGRLYCGTARPYPSKPGSLQGYGYLLQAYIRCKQSCYLSSRLPVRGRHE